MPSVGSSRMTLAVKATKEFALAAKLRGGFSFYLIPLRGSHDSILGLLTAFFDDNDEPLAIRTPLCQEEVTRCFVSLLSADVISVHFFDDHNREVLGCRAENPSAGRFRTLSSKLRFLPASLESARRFLDEAQFWFGDRTTSDDESALTIHLRESLFPENLGEEKVENPGEFNEPDIAEALLAAFEKDQIWLNPVRPDNRREFVDVLVATTDTLILVQAKDSPITQGALSRRIHRKAATSFKHVKKAAGQLKGSINHLAAHKSIDLFVDGQLRSVSAAGRNVYGLVLVKEVFDAERPTSSLPVIELSKETATPCVLLEYAEFRQMTFSQRSEEEFVRSLREISSAAHTHGVFPRSRFGLREDRSVVYEPQRTTMGQSAKVAGTARLLGDNRHASTTASPVKSSTTHAAGVDLETGLPGWLSVVVGRSEVEALDTVRVARALSLTLADRAAIKRYRGRVDLAFDGYSNDRRELYEIPEVRRFVAKLDAAFPYWFYFVSTESPAFGTISASLCSTVKPRPGYVAFGPDLVEFIARHFEALNWLVDNYSLDESDNIDVSHRVAMYFRNFEQ